MAISSSSISTFGSLQPRGNAMSGAVNFIRGKASQSISGVKSKIGGLGSNIGEKIKNISTKPKSNVGERSNLVSHFEPNSSNLLEAFKKKENNLVYSLI